MPKAAPDKPTTPRTSGRKLVPLRRQAELSKHLRPNQPVTGRQQNKQQIADQGVGQVDSAAEIIAAIPDGKAPSLGRPVRCGSADAARFALPVCMGSAKLRITRGGQSEQQDGRQKGDKATTAPAK